MSNLPYFMQSQLIEIGVLPASYFQELEEMQKPPPAREYGKFRDPRDENGEVPF